MSEHRFLAPNLVGKRVPFLAILLETRCHTRYGYPGRWVDVRLEDLREVIRRSYLPEDRRFVLVEFWPSGNEPNDEETVVPDGVWDGPVIVQGGEDGQDRLLFRRAGRIELRAVPKRGTKVVFVPRFA